MKRIKKRYFVSAIGSDDKGNYPIHCTYIVAKGWFNHIDCSNDFKKEYDLKTAVITFYKFQGFEWSK